MKMEYLSGPGPGFNPLSTSAEKLLFWFIFAAIRV
jgi:hypothetical protein